MTDYAAILPRGRENAMPARRLAALLGFSNTRALRRDIAQCREAGQVILSSTSGGYYLPASREEISRFVAARKSGVKSTFATLGAAQRALEDLDGQIGLDRSSRQEMEG